MGSGGIHNLSQRDWANFVHVMSLSFINTFTPSHKQHIYILTGLWDCSLISRSGLLQISVRSGKVPS